MQDPLDLLKLIHEQHVPDTLLTRIEEKIQHHKKNNFYVKHFRLAAACLLVLTVLNVSVSGFFNKNSKSIKKEIGIDINNNMLYNEE